jgi:hypothetical protein
MRISYAGSFHTHLREKHQPDTFLYLKLQSLVGTILKLLLLRNLAMKRPQKH